MAEILPPKRSDVLVQRDMRRGRNVRTLLPKNWSKRLVSVTSRIASANRSTIPERGNLARVSPNARNIKGNYIRSASAERSSDCIIAAHI